MKQHRVSLYHYRQTQTLENVCSIFCYFNSSVAIACDSHVLFLSHTALVPFVMFPSLQAPSSPAQVPAAPTLFASTGHLMPHNCFSCFPSTAPFAHCLPWFWTPHPPLISVVLTCECTALCCSRLTAWPKVLPHMSQAKGLVPLCERRTCTSRPWGVEKTWGESACRGQASQNARKEPGINQDQNCGNRFLPCCTWRTCRSRWWWVRGGIEALPPPWFHLGPSPAAAQAGPLHRGLVLLLRIAQKVLTQGNRSHHRVPGLSHALHCRGQSLSSAHRRGPGLRYAPGLGRACSSAPNASAQSHPGCPMHMVWRVQRMAVPHPERGRQNAQRLWKHKAWSISGVCSTATTCCAQSNSRAWHEF